MEKKLVRIDKWLWAARFFKTRSEAAKAVSGGLVQVNGARVKPAKIVVQGEEIRIRRDELEFVILVQGVAHQRRPAVEARELYKETEASIAARELRREQSRLIRSDLIAPPGRPNKRDRRLIRSLIRKT